MVHYFPWDDGEELEGSPLNQYMGYGRNVSQTQSYVTATAGSTGFTGATPLVFLNVRNVGSHVAYIRTDNATAPATSGYPLGSEESLTINGGADGLGSLYYICESGSVADLRMLGTY